jgi:hypothetical protein
MEGIDSTDEVLQGSDEEFLAKLKVWHDAAKKNRQIMDWNWYLYDNYYRGNHYIQFNKRTNQIVTPPRPKGQIRLTVNVIYSICRAIRNFATSYRPKWEVATDSTTEDEINNSRKSADTLDFYYDHLELPKKIKGIANYIIKYGIGYFQYGWDEEATGLDNQKGEVDVWTRDPFDVYLDPAGMETGDIQNCRYIDIAVSKPIQDIINNKVYEAKLKAANLQAEDISGSTTRAASEFKQILIQNQYAGSFGSEDEFKTVILHETLYKKLVKDDTQVWVASWIEGHLLRNEQTEFNKYNLIPIPSDDNPNEIYGEGYIKNLVPLNKVLNRLESQVVEYNNLVNRGRIIADKDAGINKITNETGEIIEKNAGADVHDMQPAGLAPDMNAQINRMRDYIKEISGVLDAFMGKVPEGVKSGVALESLKAQTANNLQDIKDNLEVGLGQLGEGILETLANEVVAPRQLKTAGKDGKSEYFKIKGQVGVGANEELSDDTYVIGNQNQVKVIIGSGLAYTREGRITRLDKLLEQKVIGPEAYLKGIEFGNIDEVVQEATKAKFNDAMLSNIEKNGLRGPVQGAPEMPMAGGAPTGQPAGQMPPQGAQGQVGGQAPQPPNPEDPNFWPALAEYENYQMLNGQNLPPTKNATKEHTAIHIAFSQSDDAQTNEQLLAMLLEHIKGEEKMSGMPTKGKQNV